MEKVLWKNELIYREKKSLLPPDKFSEDLSEAQQYYELMKERGKFPHSSLYKYKESMVRGENALKEMEVYNMAKIIAIANQKGGVAKTTTTGALAAGLVKRGYKVLAVDLDAQGNLSDSVGAEENTETTYELMKGTVSAKEVIQNKEVFDIIPSNLSLASADMEFTQTGREYKLKKALLPVLQEYDYIIFDTPPTLGIMTVNAFIAADEVIIPASGYDGVKGLVNLFQTINIVKEFGNEKLYIAGILLTMYNPRAVIDQNIRELAENIGSQLNTKVFNTYIRKSVIVDEAKAVRQDIFSYNEKNNVSVDYNNFIEEYLKGDIQ